MPYDVPCPPVKRMRRDGEGGPVDQTWDRSSGSSSTGLDRRVIPNRLAMEQARSAEVYSLPPPQNAYQGLVLEAIAPHYSSRTLLHHFPKPFQAPPDPAPVWKIPETFYLSLDGGEDSTENPYLHPLDWGHRINYALESTVFSVDPSKKDKDIVTLAKVADSVFVSSVKSSPDLQEVAIGDSRGTLSVFDLKSQASRLNREFGNADGSPIFCVGWRSEDSELTLGLNGLIIHVDKRLKDPAWTLSLESGQPTCSIDWNRSETLMGTGNAANLMRVFDVRNMQKERPVYRLESQSAMKALQWNPLKSDVLIGGDGILDGHLYVINLKEKRVACKEDFSSEICDLTWLDEEHVVIGASSEGLEPLSVWRYRESFTSLQKIKGITAQGGRILNIAKDPRSADICSHSTQQNLCFWRPEKINIELTDRERRIAQRTPLKSPEVR